MEFSPRGFQRAAQRVTHPEQHQHPAPSGGAPAPAPAPENQGSKESIVQSFDKLKSSKGVRFLTLILFGSLLVLGLSSIFGLSVGSTKESWAINKEGLQVVAMADGQAYFGNIVSITSRFIVLTDVFYLNDANANKANSSQNLQLIKRGCEIHAPQDRMVIYREQVNFWENLNNSGRVATAIAEWKEKNPNGQECSDDAISNPQGGTTPQGSTPTGTENENPDASGDDSSSTDETTPTDQSTESETPAPTDGTTEETTGEEPSN